MLMLISTSLEGKYLKTGNKLGKEDVSLLWCKRKKGLDRKPEDYLLIWNKELNKYVYLSSLYPVGKGRYLLDNRKERFILEVKKDGEVCIRKV